MRLAGVVGVVGNVLICREEENMTGRNVVEVVAVLEVEARISESGASSRRQ